MAESSNQIIIHIPSSLGAEKKAMERAAEVARSMGFSPDRVEDLKTAVGEACTNAIEHGNEFDAATKVGIVLTVDEKSLKVDVHDKGTDIGSTTSPDIGKKVADEESKRGWGKFLIESLVDGVTFASTPEGGNIVTMVIYLDK